MKIEIKSITLQNFKKERYKTLSFAHNVLISGGNETGKSTIYVLICGVCLVLQAVRTL